MKSKTFLNLFVTVFLLVACLILVLYFSMKETRSHEILINSFKGAYIYAVVVGSSSLVYSWVRLKGWNNVFFFTSLFINIIFSISLATINSMNSMVADYKFYTEMFYTIILTIAQIITFVILSRKNRIQDTTSDN